VIVWSLREVGTKSSLYQISSGYLKISRYSFLALAVVGLLGSVTGLFAQGQGQQQQVTPTPSNVRVVATSPQLADIVTLIHLFFVRVYLLDCNRVALGAKDVNQRKFEGLA